MEYGVAMGMHYHQVLREATPKDLRYFVALKNIEVKEAQRAQKRLKARK